MTFDYKLFCRNVTLLRKIRGYSKYEMSIQADIYYQYYCKIENGKSCPNFKAVIAIANALNTNLSNLLNSKHCTKKDFIKNNIINEINRINNEFFIKECYEILMVLRNQVDIKDEGI